MKNLLNIESCPICKRENSKLVFETLYKNEKINVYRCNSCSFDFVNNNIAPQEGSDHSTSETPETSETPKAVLDRYYQDYEQDKDVASKSLDLRMPIFEKIYKQKIQKVLEVGCGPATAYSWFNDRNIDWIGAEVDKIALRHAQKLNLPVSKINVSDFKEQFDLVYFHQVLEHVMDPIDFLLEINRSLKPGGIIAIGVPNNNGFTAIFRRLFKKKYPLDYGFIQIPYHLRAYNKKSIKNVMEKTGFQVCSLMEVTHFDSVYGEWYLTKNSFISKLIFKIGSIFGYGTLLYAIGKKQIPHE